MIADPYSVLGISPSASNEEVKRAYRDLSRKYHPDSYSNNPLADLAEEKFKEVQEAYKQIMDERERGYSNGNSSQYNQNTYNGGYSGQSYNQGYSQTSYEESQEMREIYSMLMMQRFREGLNALSRIPERGARWHYYNAIAYQGLGNVITAMGHAKQAVAMEPMNTEYSQFLMQLQNNSRNYRYNGGVRTHNDSDMCDMCCKLWFADTLCECMGGDLCTCM